MLSVPPLYDREYYKIKDVRISIDKNIEYYLYTGRFLGYDQNNIVELKASIKKNTESWYKEIVGKPVKDQSKDSNKKYSCREPWSQMAVYADGTIIPCCTPFGRGGGAKQSPPCQWRHQNSFFECCVDQ